ncbi:uncharacterized protein KY384_000369 [Bacidia gigantensis]|uniref:uncharacterized protein n=1 Tax=Bacidia gigantensis TaxID=2732470 RepID=UPI001D05298F|nr:uncharacterized protein KY384_000369 [Bacidia gigantensis]KAG8526376.1 hypothetical protein KY384_000369 [Bacidia gigantensis]
MTERAKALQDAQKTQWERSISWAKEHRYQIVGGSWVLSMVASLSFVGRNPYLSSAQKLVQARVYAQGLTLAVLIASAVFELSDRDQGEGRWETIKVLDPDDPEHKHLIEKKVHKESYQGEDQWRDMVEAEEQKENLRKDEAHQKHQEREKKEQHKSKSKDHDKAGEQAAKEKEKDKASEHGEKEKDHSKAEKQKEKEKSK